MLRTLAVLVLALAIYSCTFLFGEEIARLQINKTSDESLVVQEVTLSLTKNEDISFWSEIDFEVENNIGLAYTIDIWRDSLQIGALLLNALETNPTLLEKKIEIGNKLKWSFTGKMDHITIEEDGEYTFKAIINSNRNPTLNLKKAELILKK